MIRSFLADRRGAYAVIMGFLAIPLMLSVGLGVDYARYLRAEAHLQRLADAASLAMAASRAPDETALRKVGNDFIAANYSANEVDNLHVASLEGTTEKVDLTLGGTVQTSFMALANINTLDVKANSLAIRAVSGSVEVSLVLDNTWSMSEMADSSTTKIAALKKAATDLVDEVFKNTDAPIKVGLVPYADYVNVGKQNRGSSWLNIPADYSVMHNGSCTTVTSKRGACLAYAPQKTCTSNTDGVISTYQCGGGCTQYAPDVPVTPYQSCSNDYVTNYTWYGCVGSRANGAKPILDDGEPAYRYPGYLDTSQKCLNPIVPLTDSKNTLVSAINNLIINIGSYKPSTYIPAGIMWGINQLSPSAPFTEGQAYDPNNIAPRKVMVLMTDGYNTLQFRASDGRHVGFDAGRQTDERQQSNANAATLCTYAKKQKIEIFSVAFIVANPSASADDKAKEDEAKTLLQGCATDAQHYYDATNSEALAQAFSGIAQSLTNVRLAR
ncbi:MAG: pilus assembly protein TadG-related protein [Rhizobiaceae bacterium]